MEKIIFIFCLKKAPSNTYIADYRIIMICYFVIEQILYFFLNFARIL